MDYTSLSPVSVPDGHKDRFGYEGEVVLDAADSVSLPILIPTDINNVVVTISFPEAASEFAKGRVETSTDAVKKIKEGSSDVVWIPWTSGDTFQDCQDFCPPVSALRLVRVEDVGQIKLTVRAQ